MTPPVEICSVDDILVPPRFLDSPYEEISWTPNALGVDPGIDPLERPTDHRVVVVHGAEQMGVTSALLWLLAKAYPLDLERMPAYLTARESGLGTTRTDATLAKAAAKFGYYRSPPDPETLRLAIDEIDAASAKKRQRIIDFIADNPRHRYLLGGREDCAAKLSAELEERGVEFIQLFLGTFGYRELGLLAERTRDGEEADLDAIASLIVNWKLPRTPGTMRTLIAVSATRSESDGQSEGSLLEGYADRLLDAERAGLPNLGLDPRQRVHLLAEIAKVLDEAPDRRLPMLKAEQRLVECLRRKGLSGSADRIVRRLISRGVLVERGKQLEFRDRALQQVFLAHWMAERPSRRGKLLGDCNRNRDAIRHCAWLKRNDPQILRRVTAHTASIAADFVPAATEIDDLFSPFTLARPWEKNTLDAILRLMPTSVSGAGLYEGDRLTSAIEREVENGDRLAEEAQALSEAVGLLSNVLESSELVDDVELKQDAFETAVTGATQLIGALMAETDDEQSFRRLISDQLAGVLGEQAWGSDREEEGTLLIFTLTTGSLFLQARLGRSDLAETIAAALDRGKLTRSRCADCLATWLYVRLELPGWPQRLSGLLDRLPNGSLLRNATVANCIDNLRSPCSETVAEELVTVLVEKNASRPRHRRRILTDLTHYRSERPRDPVGVNAGG